MGPFWHVTTAADNASISVAQAASIGSAHVVTGLYAGFNNAATLGVVTVTVGGTPVITLRFVGQIALNNLALELPNSISQPVGITLNASGAAGVFGSVLLNGFTR